MTDAVGYGTVFVWQGDGVAAASTRVDLLAQLTTALGTPITKNPAVAEGLVHIRFLTPTQTGYREIAALDGSTQARLIDGRVQLEPARDAVDWDRRGTERPIEQLVTEIVAQLEAALDPGPIRVDLTAGRDTRLILAGLFHLGAAEHLDFYTIGGPLLEDVCVAQARATQLDLSHEAGMPFTIPTEPFDDQFRRHAAITAGMSNPKDAFRLPESFHDYRRVSGLFGELLRGWRSMGSGKQSSERNADRIAMRFGVGKLDLLARDARTRVEQRVRAEIVDPTDPDRLGRHAAHRFYTRNRLRSRACRIDDMTPEARCYPLLSRSLVELGLDAMWHHHDEPFDDLIVAQLAPVLLEPPPPLPAADALAPVAMNSAGKPTSVMQQALRHSSQARRELFLELAATESAAWDVIHRDAFEAAANNYTGLDNNAVGLIQGAACAVEWLSSG
jgi:hypothetical protein